jgi:hypothetical protein
VAAVVKPRTPRERELIHAITEIHAEAEAVVWDSDGQVRPGMGGLAVAVLAALNVVDPGAGGTSDG